jgi:cytochrome c oxidase assembly factor CtaG
LRGYAFAVAILAAASPSGLLLPLHATPDDQPPPLTPARLLTAWEWDWVVALVLLAVATLYLTGVLVLHRRGVHWPLGRTLAFLVGGLGTAVIALLSALGTYDTVLLSVHMAQHMILSMITPLFLVLGAPITLALRTLPAGPRSGLVRVIHSPPARVLAFPPVALALFIVTPFALYYSAWYPLTLRSEFWHNFTHLHFVLTGALLMWILVGRDPVPYPVSYALRVLLMFVTLPFHAFLGVTILSSNSLIAGSWYEAFHRTWGPTLAQDQYLAGSILWVAGDVIALILMSVLFAQWALESQREARREDRRLDLLEAQARNRARAAATVRSSTNDE